MKISSNKDSKNKISTHIISLAKEEMLSEKSELTSASKEGLVLQCPKKSLLVSEKNMPNFLGEKVELFLSHYELPFYGIIDEIRPKGEKSFSVKVDFTEDIPLYYRECVEELLNKK